MPTSSNTRIAALYRYPVKGLSPQRLSRIEVSPGETIPLDRFYALENGPSGFNAEEPSHLPKSRFLMLMKQEKLAAMTTVFDEDDHVLAVFEDGRERISGCLRTEDGRTAIETFFAERFAGELRGSPKVLTCAGFSFSDVPDKCVSIVNLESVRDLERKIGMPVDPLRFRANIYVEGVPAWSEFDWADKTFDSGGVALSVFSRIQRCAATDVDPATGARDRAIPRALMEQYGHRDCGVYATIGSNGVLGEGNTITATDGAMLPF